MPTGCHTFGSLSGANQDCLQCWSPGVALMSEIWVDCCCCHWKFQLMFLSLSLSGRDWRSVQPTNSVCSILCVRCVSRTRLALGLPSGKPNGLHPSIGAKVQNTALKHSRRVCFVSRSLLFSLFLPGSLKFALVLPCSLWFSLVLRGFLCFVFACVPVFMCVFV